MLPLELVENWFGLNAHWDPRRQTVNLDPAYLLPREEQEKRAQSWRRGSGVKRDINVEALPYSSQRPRLLSWPYGNAEFSVSSTDLNTGEMEHSGSLRLTGDLLTFSGDLFATSRSSGQRDARLTLSRFESGGRAFGPLGVTRFAIGDVSSQSAPLIGASYSGLGLSVSNERLQRGTNYDTTIIEGDALPGWTAELYLDGQLLDFQTVSDVGRYSFTNIQLAFGVNRFTVELYGPSGERDTSQRRIDIREAALRPGQFEGALEIVAPSRGVFINHQPTNSPADDDTASHLASSPDLAAQLRGAWGVGRRFTVSASGGVEQFEDAQETWALQGGVARQLERSFWSADFALANGASAGLVTMRADLGPANLLAFTERYGSGFRAGASSAASTSFIARDGARLDGRNSYDPDGRPWSWSLNVERKVDETSAPDWIASARLNKQFSHLSFLQSVRYNTNGVSVDALGDSTGATTAIAGVVSGVRVRAGVEYALDGADGARRAEFDLSKRIGNLNVAGFARQNLQVASTSLGARFAYDWDGTRLGLQIDRDSASRVTTALLTLGLEFDRSPINGGLRLGRSARGRRGAALVRVFEDRDLNNRYDEGESVLDAELTVAPYGRRTSAEDGRIIVQDLPTDRRIGVIVNPGSLADPYLAPAVEGVSFTARPGGVVRVDLPVIETGEVLVTLLDHVNEPIAGQILDLRLCDDQSAMMRERSAFDGLTFFQFVPPGCYRLGIGDTPLAQFELGAGESRNIEVLSPDAVSSAASVN